MIYNDNKMTTVDNNWGGKDVDDKMIMLKNNNFRFADCLILIHSHEWKKLFDTTIVKKLFKGNPSDYLITSSTLAPHLSARWKQIMALLQRLASIRFSLIISTS